MVQRVVLDRAVHSTVSSLYENVINLAHDHYTANLPPGITWLIDQLTWRTNAGFSLHDCHDGFKIANQAYLKDKKFTSANFGIFASLRDSYDAFVTGIATWLPRVVLFEDWDMPQQDQYELWALLGLKPQLIESLLVLQLRCPDGRLRLAKACADDTGGAGLVATCLVAIGEFRAWPDSTWISIASSSRTMP